MLLGCAALAIAGLRVSRLAGCLGGVGAGLVAFAFRDPERAIEANLALALAPADGRVLHIGQVFDEYWQAELLEVGIFLALWNVHVQRAPLEGTVLERRRRAGGYKPAMTAAATHGNHQLATYLQTKAGPCTVTQISGILARRIVNWTSVGERLRQGERLGMIKFGSQVTVRLPLSARILVSVGDEVRAGVTPIAGLGEPPAEG